MHYLWLLLKVLGLWSLLALPVALLVARFLGRADRTPEPKKRRVA